ncbi:hypothetical protein ABZW18_33925 [Streptomyces sp. NPDC004647]|uniref:hypothetical protein n=1 Tax=Streptomyces sp. NPDC004647 TaxID=3154671 RepID=UPI0033B65816
MSKKEGHKPKRSDKSKEPTASKPLRSGDPQLPVFVLGDPEQAQAGDPKRAEPGEPRQASYPEIAAPLKTKIKLKASPDGDIAITVESHALSPTSIVATWVLLVVGGIWGGWNVYRMLHGIGPAWLPPAGALAATVAIIGGGWRAVRRGLAMLRHTLTKHAEQSDEGQ